MNDHSQAPAISRRRFIQASAAATVGLVLAACGDDGVTANTAQNEAPVAAATAQPPATTEASPTAASAQSAETATLQPTPECGDDDDEPTLAQTEGPYFTPNSPERASLLEPGMAGTMLVVTGRVLATDCQPIAGALIDVWQADDSGAYDNSGYRLRGHQFTAADGTYRLETIVPGLYPGRTRHIHVKVQRPNSAVLTTQLYFPNEPRNAQDGIFNAALLLNVQANTSDQQASFDFVLT